jgi:hypothetical protein
VGGGLLAPRSAVRRSNSAASTRAAVAARAHGIMKTCGDSATISVNSPSRGLRTKTLRLLAGSTRWVRIDVLACEQRRRRSASLYAASFFDGSWNKSSTVSAGTKVPR